MKRSRPILFLLIISITFQSAQLNASIFDFFRKTTTDVINYFSKNPAHAVCVGAFCMFGLHHYYMHRVVVKLHTENSGLKSKVGTLENKSALTAETLTPEIEKVVVKEITEVYTAPLKEIDKIRADVDSANDIIKKLITAETVDQKIKDQFALLPANLTTETVDKKIVDAIQPFNGLPALVTTFSNTSDLTKTNITELKKLVGTLQERITLVETAKVEKDVPQIVGQINEISCEFNCHKKHEELNKKIDNLKSIVTTFIKQAQNDINSAKETANTANEDCKTFTVEIAKIKEEFKVLNEKIIYHVNKVYDLENRLLGDDELNKNESSELIKKDQKRTSFDTNLPKHKLIIQTSSQTIEPLESIEKGKTLGDAIVMRRKEKLSEHLDSDDDVPELIEKHEPDDLNISNLITTTPINKTKLLDSVETIGKNVNTEFEFDLDEINAAQQKLNELETIK